MRIVNLYAAWEAAEPGDGNDAKAADWSRIRRMRRPILSPPTEPLQCPADVPGAVSWWRVIPPSDRHERSAGRAADRNPIGRSDDPSMTRSVSAEPTTGANLNPCPLKPAA